MLWTVNYYDDYGRVTKVYKQHDKGGTVSSGNYDEITNTYDFTNELLTSTRSHKVGSIQQLSTLTEYNYDHQGRKTNTWETITYGSTVGPRTLIDQNNYNDIGQLQGKKLHSTKSSSSCLQNIV